MKIKSEFVTNSSSASFIILKKDLSPCQIFYIYNHAEVGEILAEKMGVSIWPDSWRISETDTTIEGDTIMDSFDMEWYLNQIGVKPEKVKFSGDNYDYC